MKIFDFVRESEFFRNLVEKKPLDEVFELLRWLKYESRKRGDYLFRHGDVGDKFYIILSGIVGVQIPAMVKKEETASEVEVNQMRSGHSFGELALIYD